MSQEPFGDSPYGQPPYKPTQKEWDDASNTLNTYNDQNGGGTIDWDAARNVFDQAATQGGNFGDWVNNTWANSSSWRNVGAPAATPTSSTPTSNPNSVQRQGWTRQNVLETLSRYGAPTQANLIRAVQENPWLGQVTGNGKITDIYGTGHTWDVIGNFGDTTGSTTHWQTLTGNTARANGGGGGGNSSSSTSTISSGAPHVPTTPHHNPPHDPRVDELYNTLLNRSRQSLAIDRNDPIIRAQADAYSANEERSRRDDLANLAEKAGPNANLRGEQRLGQERVGQRTGAMEAQLMGRELTDRRKEIADALSSMQGLLTDQQRLGLQQELAYMDDAIRRLQLDQQESQFGRSLDLDWSRLNSSNDQFAANYGLNVMDRSNYWDAFYRGL